MFIQQLKQGLALSLVAFLAACGSNQGATVPLSENGYVLTVEVGSGDTKESVAQRYGGEVIAWMGEKAILKMTSQAVAQMQAKGISYQATSLATNGSLAAPEVSAAGWNAWGSGWNAWSSGWNAWSGGWNAWSSGTGTPTPPAENDALWKQIKLYQANQVALNFGRGIKVAVIDTGVDTTHPAFSGRLAPSSEWRDFLDNDNNPQEVGSSVDRGYGHGTAVAGIIAQIAPKATILPIRVLNKDGAGNLDTVISAINYAVNAGVKVINVSLGSYDYYAPLADVINYAVSRRVLIVASAGNDGSTGAATFPAEMAWYSGAYPFQQYLYGIGSVSSANTLSTFTNRGDQVVSYAPGEGIVTAYPGSRLVRATGTSFSAPLYSGALALAWGENPTMSDVRNLHTYFMNHTQWPSGFLSNNYGILNLEGAVRGARGLTGANILASPWMHTTLFWNWSQNYLLLEPGYNDWAGGQIPGEGGMGQVVTDLRPNTTYIFGGWVRVDNAAYPATIGAKNYGGTARFITFNNTGWAWAEMSFTTGPSSTSAEVYIWKDGTIGSVMFDQFQLIRK